MKALKVLNYIYFELNKNNTKGVLIEPKIIKEAIAELENIKNTKHSKDILNEANEQKDHIKEKPNYPTITDTSSKYSYVSLEKRIKHIENTLEEIFRASAYSEDALHENNTVWNYFKSKQ